MKTDKLTFITSVYGPKKAPLYLWILLLMSCLGFISAFFIEGTAVARFIYGDVCLILAVEFLVEIIMHKGYSETQAIMYTEWDDVWLEYPTLTDHPVYSAAMEALSVEYDKEHNHMRIKGFEKYIHILAPAPFEVLEDFFKNNGIKVSEKDLSHPFRELVCDIRSIWTGST